MGEEKNPHQIDRRDAKDCFVESLSDYFAKGKIHFNFAKYDKSRPPGQRQTDAVNIFFSVGKLLEICRKFESGEMRFLYQQSRQSNDSNPLESWIGGTSAEKLKQYGNARADGMSQSRTAKLFCGKKADFLFIAESGPGETNEKGLIVPKFGKNPENKVMVGMSWNDLAEFFLITRQHYEAWLAADYLMQRMNGTKVASEQRKAPQVSRSSQMSNSSQMLATNMQQVQQTPQRNYQQIMPMSMASNHQVSQGTYTGRMPAMNTQQNQQMYN